MRRYLGAAAGLLLLACATSSPNASTTTGEAVAAADAWLRLVDAGRYSESWDSAAQLFKSAVTRDQWVQAVTAVRSPLGELRSRSMRNATFTRTAPGAPDGEYVIITYASSFASKAAAVETVTPMRDPDGAWRVSGYYIR